MKNLIAEKYLEMLVPGNIEEQGVGTEGNLDFRGVCECVVKGVEIDYRDKKHRALGWFPLNQQHIDMRENDYRIRPNPL